MRKPAADTTFRKLSLAPGYLIVRNSGVTLIAITVAEDFDLPVLARRPGLERCNMYKVLLLAAALFLSACSDAGNSRQAEVSASKEELGQMNQDFAAALNAKDAKAAAALYTEDAVLIPPGEPLVQGRAAIEEYWKGAIESAGVRDVSVETIDAFSLGSLGYETGSFVLTANGPDGEAVIERGRYVELLRRGSDGKWYSTHGIWNPAPAASGP